MRRLIVIGIVLFSLLAVGTANARGAVIGVDELSGQTRTELLDRITKARQTDGAAFAILAQVRASVAARDAHKRGRLAVITPSLKGMGQRGLMPMLEELAVTADPKGSLTDSAWLAWQISLLEGIGSLRHPHAEAVLSAVLDSSNVTNFTVLRAATKALGKIGSDSAAAKLVSLSKVKSSKQLAIFAGMGRCRRAVVAERLAEVIGNAKDPRTATVLAESLGEIGAAWAWEVPVVAASGEEQPTRAIAAQALVGAFGAVADSHTRQVFTASILMVDHDSTASLIANERSGASGELAVALDALKARWDNSPFRK